MMVKALAIVEVDGMAWYSLVFLGTMDTYPLRHDHQRWTILNQSGEGVSFDQDGVFSHGKHHCCHHRHNRSQEKS